MRILFFSMLTTITLAQKANFDPTLIDISSFDKTNFEPNKIPIIKKSISFIKIIHNSPEEQLFFDEKFFSKLKICGDWVFLYSEDLFNYMKGNNRSYTGYLAFDNRKNKKIKIVHNVVEESELLYSYLVEEYLIITKLENHDYDLISNENNENNTNPNYLKFAVLEFGNKSFQILNEKNARDIIKKYKPEILN